VIIRDVTDDELGRFEQNGWVKLDGLVDRAFVGQVLDAGKALIERSAAKYEADDSLDEERREYLDTGECEVYLSTIYGSLAQKIRCEPFSSLKRSAGLGAAAHRLMNRKRLTDDEIPVRLIGDVLISMPPSRSSRGLNFHQDAPGTTCVGSSNMWIALDQVVPKQGGIRYLSGSHREGALGEFGVHEQVTGDDLIRRYPKLLDLYELSPPFHFQPGDVLVQHCYTIHGTAENRTDRPRWSYIVVHGPGDNPALSEAPVVYPAPAD
jgi:hypothetical protein